MPLTIRPLLMITAGVLLVVLGLSGGVAAGPLQDARVAWRRGDVETAYALVRPLAEGGDAAAQVFIGSLLYEKSRNEAIEWFKKAAEQGDGDASEAQMDIYSLGDGVPRDYEEAAKWAFKAADSGRLNAYLELAHRHSDGRGVPRDYVQSYRWFTIAVHAIGVPEIRARVDEHRYGLSKLMTPEEIAEAEKLAGEWRRKR